MIGRLALLALLGAAPVQAQTVVLVRHAEKAAAPAADPPLTPAGQARAEALSQRLQGARVSAILTSQFARTRETAAPLSAQTGVPVTVVPIGGSLHEHLAATVALARRAPAGSTVVIVGHSNTAPLLAKALGWSDPPQIADCRYDLLLQLDLGKPEPAPQRYGAQSTC
jgi:phosphohistidine phosphatase SixA